MSSVNPPNDASIIIVNWNTRALLLECLETLLRIPFRHKVEIIVVDNGSEDGSQEAVLSLGSAVRLIENRVNLGFAKANNVGIRASNGRYLCLMNSDVRVLDDCVDLLYEFMERNASIGLAGPKILSPNMALQDSCRKFPTIWNSLCGALRLNRLLPKSAFFSDEHMAYFSHDKTISVDSLAGCFLMIRKEVMEKVGLFDEQFFIYAEEVDLCKRLRAFGRDVVFYPEARAIHHHGASSARQPIRFALEQQRSVLKYWRKHHELFARVLFRVLLVAQHAIGGVSAMALYAVRPAERPVLAQRAKTNVVLMRALFLSGTQVS
jgi:GT2 family glycosyltransferase